jgi:RNA polymerase sigma factor (sigma-70 family)
VEKNPVFDAAKLKSASAGSSVDGRRGPPKSTGGRKSTQSVMNDHPSTRATPGDVGPSLTSNSMLRRIKGGGGDSVWRPFHQRYERRLLVFIMAKMGDAVRRERSAEDVFQEVVLRFLKSIDTFESRGPGSMYNFLCRLALNVIAEVGRRGGQGRRVIEGAGRIGMDDVDQMVADSDTGPMTRVERSDECLRLYAALFDERMSEKYRAPLFRVYIEGRDRMDVAHELGTKAMTLRKHLTRGVTLWRKIAGIHPDEFFGGESPEEEAPQG